MAYPNRVSHHQLKKRITQTDIQTSNLINGLPQTGKPFSDF
jgi:hypothetical protein